VSKENVKKFYKALKADKALAEELHNAVNAVVLQFAAKQNLAFTAEELVDFETEVRKLSEAELNQVSAAGGVAGYATCTPGVCLYLDGSIDTIG